MKRFHLFRYRLRYWAVYLVTPHNGIDAKYCLYADKIPYPPYLLLMIIRIKFNKDKCD